MKKVTRYTWKQSAEGAPAPAFDSFEDARQHLLTQNRDKVVRPERAFTQEALDDFASSLKPLGTPTSFKQVATSKRGGMTFRVFVAEFPGRSLRITVFEEPDGKLEQYLVGVTGS